MSIDWSKAPEGATHWDTGINKRVAGWMKLDDGVWYWWPAANAFSCPKKWHASLNQHMVQTEGFVERPAPWTGEGLPPVGTVCEFAGFNPEETLPTDPRVGDQVTVIAHFMSGYFEVAAFTYFAPPEFEYLQVAQGAYGCFRPIRTPEQIAEEARLAELNLMIGAIKDHPGGRHGVDHLTQLKIHEEACINLYDAGWRKQVSP